MIGSSHSTCCSRDACNEALHLDAEMIGCNEHSYSVEDCRSDAVISSRNMNSQHDQRKRRDGSVLPGFFPRHCLALASLALLGTSATAMVSKSNPSYGRITNAYDPSKSSNTLKILNTVQLLREERFKRDNQQHNDVVVDHEKRRSVSSHSWTQTLFDDGISNDSSNLFHQIQPSALSSTQKNDRRQGLFFTEGKKRSHRRESEIPSTRNIAEGEEDFISSRIQQQLPSVTNFRTSLGTEVPDIELHLQMEAARARAASTTKELASYDTAFAFMDLHHEHSSSSISASPDTPNTSVVEKMAMRSIPSQLPGPAASVMENKAASTPVTTTKTKKRSPKKAKSSTKKSKRRTPTPAASTRKIKTKDISTIMATKKAATPRKEQSLDVPPGRVSPEQEIQLARIVQRGVELHQLKTEFEKRHGRDITRQEWTELAKLDSPKQLRRLVSSYRSAKNALVTANMGLVHAVVRSYMGASWNNKSVTAKGVSYEEMIQEGSLGLLRAAELFDPNRGLRFSTYATIWIKGVLGNNNLSETITLPLREKNKMKKIQKAKEDLSMENGGSADDVGRSFRPSKEDIASKCGLKTEEVRKVMSKMKSAKNVLSLDYQYDLQGRSGTDSNGQGSLSNDKNMMVDVDLVEKLQLRADVVAALTRNLDPREARLMRLRYGLKDGQQRSIAACAEAMGISKARAQQLAAGCLKKLREADDAESLQEYLLSIA